LCLPYVVSIRQPTNITAIIVIFIWQSNSIVTINRAIRITITITILTTRPIVRIVVWTIIRLTIGLIVRLITRLATRLNVRLVSRTIFTLKLRIKSYFYVWIRPTLALIVNLTQYIITFARIVTTINLATPTTIVTITTF
jgi:hypothetical protein